jgi:LPS export ABC transporter protein LptC
VIAKGFIFKIVVLGVMILVCSLARQVSSLFAQEAAEQTIADFNLSGFAEKGKKSWELSGKSADITEGKVKLKDIVGKLYGEEDITLTAERGNFDKEKGNVHLKDNVVVTTSKGAKLTTDSLDWDRQNHTVSTKDEVNIQRENLVADAVGASGQPDLKKVNLEKEVRLQINPDDDNPKDLPKKKKIVITCDGPLEVDYDKNIAIFYNNVKVDQKDTQIYSDQMNVYFKIEEDHGLNLSEDKDSEGMGRQIHKIIAKGNVKIVRGDNISYSDEAVYDAKQNKIILTGRPQLVFYSEGEDNAFAGN